jgi:hypothetical protein
VDSDTFGTVAFGPTDGATPGTIREGGTKVDMQTGQTRPVPLT